MSEIKGLEEKIDGKLRMLNFTTEDTMKILEARDAKTIERHGSTVESFIDKVHQLKLQVQELRMENGDEPDEVRLWTQTLEAKVSKYEHVLKEVKRAAVDITSDEEEKREGEKRKRILDEQMELEKAKLELCAKFENSFKGTPGDSQNLNSPGARLPKLVISKFEGTHLDWMRFWNQFETEIVKANLTQVAKFSYLKELLVPSVRASVDGLPFTTEGYERAKTLLQTKYGKPSEMANAHMQCVIGLPTVHGTQPAKIHDFYGKLSSHIQVLEIMGKVKEIGGFVRVTLDKLPGVRADLLRLDDNWQEWGFRELIESLRKWCDCNPIHSDDRKSDQLNRHPPKKSLSKRENVPPVDNSSRTQLECGNAPIVDEQQSYAKHKLGVKEGESKMLGLLWDKTEDTLAVTFPEEPTDVTKRGILRFLASVYDPLGVASPTTLTGKCLYREVCDCRLSWDEKVSDRIGQMWLKFVRNLRNKVEVPRSLPRLKEPIETVELHAFGDTSGFGISAVVYAVITQASRMSRGLVAAKSRLAKKNLTIPRLELVAAHMAANLVENVRAAIEGYPVNSVHGWIDSTVALYWISGGGIYKQFVANRVRKINAKNFIEWRHVESERNPADIGSRGCKADQLSSMWLSGPEWLSNSEMWPINIVTESSKEI